MNGSHARTARRAVWPTLIVLICVSACGSASHPGNTPPSSLSSPATINLYPVRSIHDQNRLFVFVTAVGTTSVRMPLAFDTGSAGLTLYAPDIFPETIVSA